MDRLLGMASSQERPILVAEPFDVGLEPLATDSSGHPFFISRPTFMPSRDPGNRNREDGVESLPSGWVGNGLRRNQQPTGLVGRDLLHW